MTRKNCPPRGLSYYINSHHIDGILSAFRRDCFSIDVARIARLLRDETGEREKEKEKEILKRFWNDLSHLSLVSPVFSSSFWTLELSKNEKKGRKENERTNKLSF